MKTDILKAKQNYKSELENKMAANDLGSAWSSTQTIAGLRNPKNSSHVTLDGFNSDTEFARSS